MWSAQDGVFGAHEPFLGWRTCRMWDGGRGRTHRRVAKQKQQQQLLNGSISQLTLCFGQQISTCEVTKSASVGLLMASSSTTKAAS